jgi:glycosyltransferase involved in cell wall biosynthesis
MVYSSIIITAYNRDKFLYNAINSALNQEIVNDFEIIVIRNFINSQVDELIKSNKRIIGIFFTDESIGQVLAKAISISKGTLLFFLDDDDEFLPNKLNHIEQIFLSNPTLLYYHGGYNGIDQFGFKTDKRVQSVPNKQILMSTLDINQIFKKLMIYDPYFNLSSIAIKKSIIINKIEFLKEIKTNPDNFMFYCAISNSGNICIDNLKLTNYRIHNSTTQSLIKSTHKEKIANYYLNSLKSLKIMEKISDNEFFNVNLKCVKIRCELNIFFLTGKKPDCSVLNMLKLSKCKKLPHESSLVLLLTLFVLSKLNGKLAKYIYYLTKFQK